MIPFYKPTIGLEEIDEVLATMKSGWLTTGPRTKQFEKEFAIYVSQKHAVALSSCTAALHLALEAIGLKAGQGVLVPTMTFAATAEVVRYFGARPVLADCRTSDFNLDVADAERRIQVELSSGRDVVAIMPVHYGGQIGDVTGVRDLATRYNLKIIEDAAHCCPAYYRSPVSESQDFSVSAFPNASDPNFQLSAFSFQLSGYAPVGASADITCFSFYANKCITTGEGGMACTNNDDYADRMRIMSLHGISRDAWKRFTAEGSWYYEIIAPGFKYNLTDIASAIGIHQLRKADELHRKRAALAALYTEHLASIDEITVPRQLPDRIHSWHLYCIRLDTSKTTKDRGQVISELQKRGIGTSVHWLPLHMHPYYRETYGYKPEDFPIACSLYPGLITLPLYPDMTEDDIRCVCTNLKQVLSS
jgi:perosamine synthetase